MKVEQHVYELGVGWTCHRRPPEPFRPQLVFAFGSRILLQDKRTFAALRERYPAARILSASTAGEFIGDNISEDRLCVTALTLEHGRVATAAVAVPNQWESLSAGQELGARLVGEGLTHVFVLSDGQRVNGTELTRGLNQVLPAGVTVTGGLSADGCRFEKTLVGLTEVPMEGRVVAAGFYGTTLQIGTGCSGGWIPEGETYTVTASDGNILFELDHEPAIDLYMRHVGFDAVALPASCLRFPFWVLAPDGGAPVVRTILAIEGGTRSMVFAGDIPLGSKVRFMNASADDLIQGARTAAVEARLSPEPQLALCVSCVGRRLVLGERAAHEITAMQQALGAGTLFSGFYSYGELAPAKDSGGSQLHNQTMTLTTFLES